MSSSEFSVTPTPDSSSRLSDERPWDEGTRPGGPAPDPEQRYSPEDLATAQHLIDVHDGLRAELRRLREVIDEVEAGGSDPVALRSFFNRMTIRQNNWTLGAFCQSYCRAVTGHHSLEDRSVFPHLGRADSRLGAVLTRLGEEILERIDAALVALVAGEAGAMAQVRAGVDLITDAMASHFSYEERELVEPLARLGFQ
jgi:hypothetical protein